METTLPFTGADGGLGAAAPRVLRQSENQLCLAAHPALRRWVAHYTLTYPAAHSAQPCFAIPKNLTLLPDVSGCFVFTLGPRAISGLVWGASTRAVTLAKDYDTAPPRFFVEFRPGGARALAGVWADTLTDRVEALDAVLPALYRQLALLLEDALGSGGCVLETLLARVDALLLGCLRRREPADDVAGLVLPVLASGAAPTMRALSSHTGYSERQLRRLFHASLGVGVKACARVLRVNRVATALEGGATIARVAQDAGYHDQAHLVHDFKAVCGVTPSAYRQAMADFYKEAFKF